MTKEEQMLLKHFEDLCERAYFQNRPCFSDFLDMNSQSLLLNYFHGPIPLCFMVVMTSLNER